MLSCQLECNRCYTPRWLANFRDGQDFNIHHRSYANLGNERPGDLEVLCLRCHQLEHSIGPSDYCHRCDVPLYDTVIQPSLCCECSQSHEFIRLGKMPNARLFGLFKGESLDDLYLVEQGAR